MTVAVGSTSAWKTVKPKTVLNTRSHAFKVKAFSYDQCAPLTWGTTRQRLVQPDWVIKGRGCKHQSVVRAPKRPLGIYREEQGSFPDPGFLGTSSCLSVICSKRALRSTISDSDSDINQHNPIKLNAHMYMRFAYINSDSTCISFFTGVQIYYFRTKRRIKRSKTLLCIRVPT